METFADNLKNKMLKTMQKENELIEKFSYKIFKDIYFRKVLRYQIRANITRIAIRGRSILYQRTDSPRVFMFPLIGEINSQQEKTASDDALNVPTIFDSVDVVNEKPSLLKFGPKTIKTKTKHLKFRVAHHLGEKIFFIGVSKHGYGKLFAADLKIAEEVIVAEKIKLDLEVTDVAVDQFTGDVVYSTKNNDICILQRMEYGAQVKDFANGVQKNHIPMRADGPNVS